MTDETADDQGQGEYPASERRKLALFRRVLVAFGAATILGGISLAALVAFDVSGSDNGGDPGSSRVSISWNDDPGSVYDRPLVTPRPSPAPTPAPTPLPGPPPFENAPFHMLIESIGVNAPVNTYGLDASAIPEVPLNAHEVAWYNFSAQPGTGSNAVFAGHVTWSGLGVFYYLDQVAIGETIRLIGDDGIELVYTVSGSFMVDARDPNAVSVMAGTPDDMITIITCDGSFYYTGDPVFGGDYTNRRVVQAKLTSTSAVANPVAASGG